MIHLKLKIFFWSKFLIAALGKKGHKKYFFPAHVSEEIVTLVKLDFNNLHAVHSIFSGLMAPE